MANYRFYSHQVEGEEAVEEQHLLVQLEPNHLEEGEVVVQARRKQTPRSPLLLLLRQFGTPPKASAQTRCEIVGLRFRFLLR